MQNTFFLHFPLFLLLFFLKRITKTTYHEMHEFYAMDEFYAMQILLKKKKSKEEWLQRVERESIRTMSEILN